MENFDKYAKCWANSLGDCKGPMSREHIFSNATSRKDSKIPLAVKGMANMPDRTIGFDGPTARILCQSHNSRLSILDSEAKKLADGLHKLVDGEEHTTVHVNGPLLERWALKTLINFLASGLADKKKRTPDRDLVLSTYGKTCLPGGCGLYLLRLDGYEPLSTEQSGVTPTWAGSTGGTPEACMGGIIYLHGVAFFLLLDIAFLEALRTRDLGFTKSNIPLSYDRLKYHPIAAQLSDGQGHSLAVLFDWPQGEEAPTQ